MKKKPNMENIGKKKYQPLVHEKVIKVNTYLLGTGAPFCVK